MAATLTTAVQTAAALTTEASKVVMDAYDVTTIINNINTLYTNVINQFISVSLGMLALLGVALPLLFGYFQKRKINADQKMLSGKIDSEIEEAKKLLVEEMKQELNNEKSLILKEITKIKEDLGLEVKKIQAEANAKSHHLQANTNITEKDYVGAFFDAVIAIKNYAFSEDEGNLIRVADVLLRQLILPNLNKTDFDDDKLEKSYKDVYKIIEDKNSNGRYGDCLDSLRKGFKLAMAREITVPK